jgi:hypothetical protein
VSSIVHQQWQQLLQLEPTAAAISCLQRAVLYAPQLLGLKPQRVQRRLQVLTEVCCTAGSAGGSTQQQLWLSQLRVAMVSGALGRLLLAGEYSHLCLLLCNA